MGQEPEHFALFSLSSAAAIERMGDRRLTIEEQREVFANTRTLDKVNWPDWWGARE